MQEEPLNWVLEKMEIPGLALPEQQRWQGHFRLFDTEQESREDCCKKQQHQQQEKQQQQQQEQDYRS